MVNYNRLERPVQNDSAPIVVELGLTLLQIIDVVSVKERRKKKKKSEAFCFGGQHRASKRKLNALQTFCALDVFQDFFV